MKYNEIDIEYKVISFLNDNIYHLKDVSTANLFLKEQCGIISFFDNETEILELKEFLNYGLMKVSEVNRREYGDFQTNEILSNNITKFISENSTSENFDIILEPTCGKGNFILSCLNEFKSIKKIIGIEIYSNYCWETKFRILDFFIQNPERNKPDIEIINCDVFKFRFDNLSVTNKNILIVGNPPWITNSELSTLSSENLPIKSNVKSVNGLDALTGKGNFDIAENIILNLLNHFHEESGVFAFLLKNSVVKNIVQWQKTKKFKICNIKKMNIDAKKEFKASVDSSLFIAELGKETDYTCEEQDFYTKEKFSKFGWINEKYVSSISNYSAGNEIDGLSQFEWRQGLKHDCTTIMELEKNNGHYLNKLNQKIFLEEDLVYGLLKSSDLKGGQYDSSRKYVIVTQKKIGDETSSIKENFPLTYNYLITNTSYFDKRKSKIYKNKPQFSIFGIGDYSFAPYKVAVSGLYKKTMFSLILPKNNKPIMLDDTCYFIGFDNLIFTQITQFLLNSEISLNFLNSIIFKDSKRTVTKEILMRIDIKKLICYFNFDKIKQNLTFLNERDWDKYNEFISKKPQTKQLRLL